MTRKISFAASASFFLAVCFLLIAGAPTAFADDVRVYKEGQQPNDIRLQAPKDLNGYFPFEVPAGKAAWEKRADELRRRVLVACAGKNTAQRRHSRKS